MTDRIKNLRKRRNSMEGRLKRCEISETRQTLTFKIEQINILLADMCIPVYIRKLYKTYSTF